ncbi:MAG: restriction endonuclease subunit S [Clostridiales bacterium]|nr:restriction endonuclease subunit S [Clostridiales bacterium]
MLDLQDREWASFPIERIFTIKPGKRLTKSDMTDGQRPFIGATESNNGITNFVDNENASLDKNLIGVNYNGSVVETFYHPYECIFSDDVKRFALKDKTGNRFVYLFLKTAILQQKNQIYIWLQVQRTAHEQAIYTVAHN